MGDPLSRRHALAAGAGALAALVLLSRVGPARAGLFPDDGERRFLVLRDERVIGRYRLAFLRADGLFQARVDSEIQYPLPGGRTHAFRHHSEELWRRGWLEALTSDTKDAGRRWQIRAERQREALVGHRNGHAFSISGYLITTALWHPDTPLVEGLVDSVDGYVKLIRGYSQGEEEVPVAGAAVRATRYLIRGEISREVWYDEERRLVRASLPGPDGRPVVLEAL